MRMRMRRVLRWLAGLTVAGLLIVLGLPQLPDRWNPWAPIRLADAPNFLTGLKLRQLRDEPQACQAILDTSDFVYQPVDDRVTGEGCGFHNAVRLRESRISYGGGFIVTCPLAVALALFERHALQPAAQASLGQSVAAVDHLGTYACRNIGSREGGRRSQHATANAIDIAAFRLADGTRVTIAQDWNGNGAKGRFLDEVHDGACGMFGVVLGPDYNRAHRDHFHLDLGGFALCR